MAKMFYEDAYCLGLIYAYMYSGKRMLLRSDLDKFYEAIESNLENSDVYDIYATARYDSDFDIYYCNQGSNGDVYCVLYPDFNLEKAQATYIGCLSLEVLVASQEENALRCIGLQEKDGKIVKLESSPINLDDSHIFMNKFIDNLRNGNLKIEVINQDDDFNFDQVFITDQLEKYNRLLSSDIFNRATSSNQRNKMKILKRKKK